MWIYEKKLEYPVRVSSTNPRLAKDIITQYGGPDSATPCLYPRPKQF